ncbi:MAG: xanthine dehydrogenase family protein molybdopterin-binding subunit [Hyphomonadaceae bacterium]|nr:xanthine dehydrogenase family protein molybdopterin-binding subunit [Hyphomonadaceae bacterium]
MHLAKPIYQTPDSQIENTSLEIINVSRRGFVGGATGLTFTLALAACAPKKSESKSKSEAPLPDHSTVESGPLVLISIAADGRTQITNPRSEMGQQVITAVAQMIADELDVEWDKLVIEQAVGDSKYGDQNTDGSTSIRNHINRFRMAGALMRHMLTQAAANEWGVDISECSSKLGTIEHSSGKILTYGDVAKAASKLDVPAEASVTLKRRDQWRYIGKDKPSFTIPDIIHGKGTFGIDVRVPDMVYAVIARPPTVFGKIKTLDDTAALAVPGVTKVMKLPDLQGEVAAFQPLGGVAVIATDTWAAIKGREALNVTWDAGSNANYDSDLYGQELRATARKPGEVKRNRGDVDSAMETAAKKVTADYYAPHLSQAPMEPPAATARWTGDKIECWACTQNPQAARTTVASLCGIPEENVTINVTLLGGGFGRKSKPDYVAEAALIAREVGAPVKVTWTREDDVRHGYFHSVSAQRMEAGLNEDGLPVAVLHRTVFPSINSTFGAADQGSDFELSLGATDSPWNVPNMRVEVGKAEAHIRIGWLRSVANVYHAFAQQSFAAELAHAAGKDQKDYLLDLIGPDREIDLSKDGVIYPNYGASIEEHPLDTARLKSVLDKAASMAKWGRDVPKGHGLGISVHRSFLSYVATAIEVAVDSDGNITFPGVWVAVDAGTVVNPANTKVQMEGGTLYGLSNALYGEITAKDGAVVQGNFPAWRVMRLSEAPHNLEVHIMESDAPPGGVGEPGTPPAAPALANAIFAATGQRLRTLPLLGQKNRLTMAGEG